MERRENLLRAMKASKIGLGTVKFGRNEGVKYPEKFTLPTVEELQALLQIAWDEGIRFLDTAPAYGTSEERIGRLLEQSNKDFLIGTKAGEAFKDGRSQYDFSSPAILESVGISMERLKQKHLAYVLLHSNGEDEEVLEQGGLEALIELRREGRIGLAGFSGKTRSGGITALKKGADVVMVTENLDYHEEQDVIREAMRLERGVLLKKIFSSGHTQAREKALKHVFQIPGVTAAVIGTINPGHLKQNMEMVRRLSSSVFQSAVL